MYYRSLFYASHHYIQESVSHVDLPQILTLTPLTCFSLLSSLCSSLARTWCTTAGRTLFTSIICCAHRAQSQPCELCLLFLSLLWVFSAMWIKSIGFSNSIIEESETFLSSFSKSFCTVKAERSLHELSYICTKSDQNSLVWIWRIDRHVSGYDLLAQSQSELTAQPGFHWQEATSFLQELNLFTDREKCSSASASTGRSQKKHLVSALPCFIRRWYLPLEDALHQEDKHFMLH